MRGAGRGGTPELLPILRSGQQAELLAELLATPEEEHSLTDLGRRLSIPLSSVHREIDRAERAGLVVSRKQGNVRLVRADASSPYFEPLAVLLVRAFGPPRVLASALRSIEGIDEAWIFGSWVARYAGVAGERPVGDIDLLVVGTPDRDEVVRAAGLAADRLGREVQVTFREPGWLATGTGSFHDTLVQRSRLQILPQAVHSVVDGESS